MINVNNFFSNKSTEPIGATDNDYSDIIDTVKACSRINQLSCVLVDFDRHHPIFMSENMIYLNEATFSDFKRPSENPYWSLIHEETLNALSQIYDDYSKLKNIVTHEEYINHLCVMDYPISIKGKKLFINSRFTPLKIGNDGIIKLGLFSFFPSTKIEMSFLVITSSGRRWIYDFERRTFHEYDLGDKLSITEKAVLERAKKGMSNNEIADDLYISVNTIKSHKMHIFKKLQVTNITEALVVIGNYQLI